MGEDGGSSQESKGLSSFLACLGGRSLLPLASLPRHLYRRIVMVWTQRLLEFVPRSRGFHLITEEIVRQIPELRQAEVGLLNLFLQHTSASLTINENADPDVQVDLEASLSAIAPESFPHTHTCEGPDDMPAHVKASLLGASLVIPVRDGRLAMGTWQGIYLAEHRNHAGSRRAVATLWGE